MTPKVLTSFDSSGVEHHPLVSMSNISRYSDGQGAQDGDGNGCFDSGLEGAGG